MKHDALETSRGLIADGKTQTSAVLYNPLQNHKIKIEIKAM